MALTDGTISKLKDMRNFLTQRYLRNDLLESLQISKLKLFQNSASIDEYSIYSLHQK